MNVLNAFKHILKNTQLKGKLARSHFTIAFIGVIALLVAITLFYWLRTNTLRLLNSSIPTTKTIRILETGLQTTLADLRAWVSLGDKKFVKDRRLTWNKTIFPNLSKLKTLCKKYDNVSACNDVNNVAKLLNNLNIWQWRIEDIAGVPGNYPLLMMTKTYLKPITRNIISLINALINKEQFLSRNTQARQLLIHLANFRGKFTLSSGLLVSYILNGEQKDLRNSESAMAKVKLALKQINAKKAFFNTEQLEIYAILQNTFSRYLIIASDLIKKRRSNINNIALYWLSKNAIPLAEKSEEALYKIELLENQFQNNTTNHIEILSILMPYFLFALIIIILVLSYWLSDKQAQKLVQPIESLVLATQKMAKGKLNKDIAIQSDDELGKLTENFNQMRIQRQAAEEEVNQMLMKFEKLARLDPLTNLPNRRGFNEIAENILLISKRFQRQFALLLLDLDDFKIINDTYGHDVGDELLKYVADMIKVNLRRTDHVARMGGDEIAIILSEIKHSKNAGVIANKILQQISKPCYINSHLINISASIGIACFPGSGKNLSILLKNADIALYQAKKRGKNFAYFISESNL